jgi:hypothetical protein
LILFVISYVYSWFILIAMDATSNHTSENLRASVAETIAWCAGQQLTAYIEETVEIRKWRMLAQQANKRMAQAYLRETFVE